MKIYVHTINGQPGAFDGYQVCFACRGTKQEPAYSLKQIRKEQKLSNANRKKDGLSDNCDLNYRLYTINTQV